MDLRLEFVFRSLREEKPFLELCQEYSISRKTGYKWKKRFLEQGPNGLADLSRKPATSPNQVAEDVVCEIIRIKNDHQGWGPRKIRDVYARKHPCAELPSESTFKRVLEKAGLVQKRKRRKQDACGRIETRIVPQAPNDLWTVDFKGWWYTRDRQRCEPLTVRDEFSRFVLCASALEDARSTTVRRQFEHLFTTCGMPQTIRSDNGSPFACTRAPLGLTRLSAWWVALGIDLDRIPLGRPDQNGGHERMHRDIALELEACPEIDLMHQRAALETWRHTFNFERPHEALGMRVPGEVYRKSDRLFPNEPQQLTYPAGFLTRKTSVRGAIKLQDVQITISTAIAGWHIGLNPTGPHGFLVWFGPHCLGAIDLSTESFKAADRQLAPPTTDCTQ
jgi:transposase InsO family protein